MSLTDTRPQRAVTARRNTALLWTFLVTGVALFMAQLDNLVVTTALPVIRTDLHASLPSLEWITNAYTLTFAVLLLPAATLGERFGRRRVLVAGIALFTVSSAAAALAPSVGALITARAFQGAGAAAVVPLTLTLLSAAVPVERRGMALGIWGGIAGLAIALGPVIGGAVTQGLSWQSIFWLNVPLGVLIAPIARLRLAESRGSAARLDLPGLALVSGGLFGVVFGLVRANALGWTSSVVIGSLAGGAMLLAGFIVRERVAAEPMLPLRLFRSRGFSATNLASVLMFFGMFGSIFFLAQFLQTVQHYSPLSAGLRTLPWTGMPIVVSPLAGGLADRIGSRRIVIAGLTLQAAGLAWLAAVTTPTVPYLHLIPAFIVSGTGMAMFFAPVANLVLGSVARREEGIASGTTNALRELGGVFGVAVLATVFSAHGSYLSGQAFVDGLRPALWVGTAAVAIAALAVVVVPRRAPVTDEAPATAAYDAGPTVGPDAGPAAGELVSAAAGVVPQCAESTV